MCSQRAGEFAHEANWGGAGSFFLATLLHLMFLVAFALVMTNLFIAIIGDAWEESVVDAPQWRTFSLASFAAALHFDEQGEAACSKVLVVVKELSESGRDNETRPHDKWIGRLKHVKRAVKDEVAELSGTVQQRIDRVERQVAEVRSMLQVPSPRHSTSRPKS
eukprot:COSAG01_NODE_2264_length_8047_cov_18.774409_4_plen_163_part_00